MLEIKINRILLLTIILSSFLFAQGDGRKIYDEKKEEEILFGEIYEEDFKDPDFAFWYDAEYGEYTVDSVTINNINEELKNIEIVLVMGTWCHDSHREVPRFLKILKNADYDFTKLIMYAVDGNKDAGIEDFGNFDIKFVPTFIFYDNHAEIGRIIEAPENTLEEDIANILLHSLK